MQALNMKMLLVLLCLLLPTFASACTFTWGTATTTTDGAPATGVKYKLYYIPAGTIVEQVVADTDQASISMLCPAGKYSVTAYSATAAESERSNTVNLAQMNKPTSLTWTK